MKLKKNQKGLSNLFKSFDNYAEVVSFTTMNGQSKFGSWAGAILTLLIIIVTLNYGIHKFYVMIRREDTKHQEKTIRL